MASFGVWGSAFSHRIDRPEVDPELAFDGLKAVLAMPVTRIAAQDG